MQPQARFIPRKLLLVMKLTIFLMTITFLQVSATAFSQKINLKEKNVSIDKVLSQIQDQSGYEFFYNASALKQAGTVTINLKDATVQDALDELFRNKPFSYSLDNNTITIKEKPTNFLDKLKDKVKEFIAATDVTGRVIDENNQPLSGATVTVKGTNNVTTTDLNGFFTLKQVQPDAIIVITFIGYDKKELPAAANMGTIKLNTASSPLDEVKVMAYTRESERLSVSNSVTIKGADINNQPVQNPLLALEGRVPGLFITPSNGLPGSGVSVRIQGQNSIQSGNDPLYVIDGVPYPSQTLSTTGIGAFLGKSSGTQQGGYGSPMSYINPNDIESISVLKDADATAIYGSRAANGAIIIITKKGKAGPTKMDVNLQQGWGKVPRELDLMNTQQYVQMRNEAIKNDNIAIDPIYDSDINGLWNTNKYTDWQKVLIGGTAQYSNANLNISGGSPNIQYLIGGTYNRQTSVFPGNFADQKGAMHVSLNSTSQNQRFKMQFTASYLADNNQLPSADLTSSALTLAPNAPSPLNTDGTLNWALNSAGSTSWNNPLQYLYATYQIKSDNLISNTVLSYTILPGLDIRTSLGYNSLGIDEYQAQRAQFYPPYILTLLGTHARRAAYSYNNIDTWIVEPQISYKTNIAKGNLQILLGGTIQQNNSKGLNLSGVGYNSDALLTDYLSADVKSVNSTVQSTYKYDAIFGRINYAWEDKYLLDLTARRDGSSRFGAANQFHDFGSVGLGWIFSEESLFKNVPFLSFGKIRASFGTTGSDQIGDYQYLNLYRTVSTAVSYQGVTGVASNGLPNPYLQWEETKKLQAGLDLGFLKDRILFTINYIYNRSSNELASYQLPSIAGASITENLPGTVQNTAWELSATTVNVKKGDFRWTTGINLTVPKNKLVAWSGTGIGTTYFIGQPIGSILRYHFLGVDPTTGQFQVADSHGNPTSTPNQSTDEKTLINPFPKYYGGVQNGFSYKGFSLDFLFQFARQTKQNFYFGPSLPGTYNFNEPVWILDRWQKPGDVAPFQRYNSDYNFYSQYSNALNSDAAYSDVFYARLKNLSLSYTLPSELIQKIHFQSCKLFVQGENLFTISNFKGLDPETGVTSLPPLRILTVGLQITL